MIKTIEEIDQLFTDILDEVEQLGSPDLKQKGFRKTESQNGIDGTLDLSELLTIVVSLPNVTCLPNASNKKHEATDLQVKIMFSKTFCSEILYNSANRSKFVTLIYKSCFGGAGWKHMNSGKDDTGSYIYQSFKVYTPAIIAATIAAVPLIPQETIAASLGTISRGDYKRVRRLLDSLYISAQADPSNAVAEFLKAHDSILDCTFNSTTKSYREVLLGCALARLVDPNVNIRSPYIKQGSDAFNARSLDTEVINPFLQEGYFPCTKSAYLATFRRGVRFVPETADNVKDRDGYMALLSLLDVIETAAPEDMNSIIIAILIRLIQVREQSKVVIARIERLRIDQYSLLFNDLLAQKSGGLLPVLLTVAFFQTVKDYYELQHDITWQGINVADNATGKPGDITIAKDGKPILAIEVTEQPISANRVTSTFKTKILTSNTRDYLFVYTNTLPDEDAVTTAQNVFSQGYDINFACLRDLIVNSFLTQSSVSRTTFMENMVTLLSARDVSSKVKVIWNDCIKKLSSI